MGKPEATQLTLEQYRKRTLRNEDLPKKEHDPSKGGRPRTRFTDEEEADVKKVFDKQPTRVIRAQAGPQAMFLSSSADVAIYGGCAGGGKSFALLIDPLRYVNNPNFGAVIFRRTFPQIKNEGGLWDEAMQVYPPLGAKARESDMSFWFNNGSCISFRHLQHESDVYDWQGAQLPYIGLDELTHFTKKQFWYLTSRLRSAHGFPCLMRATCNPDPDSFVADLISWWIDQDTGYAIPERSGVIRWFIRSAQDDTLFWADSKEALIKKYGANEMPRSFTFILSKLQDNKILMEKDPGYMGRLMAMDRIERERLLYGNWKIKPAPGIYFKKDNMPVVSPASVPSLVKEVRGWDLAATDKLQNAHADWTAGVKMGMGTDGFVYVLDMEYFQKAPGGVEQSVVNCARQDGRKCVIRLPQDPGQAGKHQVAYYAKLLLGNILRTRSMTGDKITRAGAFSSAAEHGRVKVVSGNWNDTFFNHLESFPPDKGSPDIVDACVEAFHELTKSHAKGALVRPVSIQTS